MKKTPKIIAMFLITVIFTSTMAAFDKGWILNMKGKVGGSLTTPFISQTDLAKLGANKMEGMVGFIGGGGAEVGYLFDNETYFNLPKDHWFSGLGLFGTVGVSQGYTGQISGSFVKVGDLEKQVDVFVSIYMTPVISFGATVKAYFFHNKLAVGFNLGSKVIADTTPEYEIYSTEPDTIPAEVGTIIVDEWMMKNMNAFSIYPEFTVEYNVKILPTTELILGGYFGYNIYSPKYVTMPKSVLDMAKGATGFDPQDKLTSYFINSFEFGLTFGLGFKLD